MNCFSSHLCDKAPEGQSVAQTPQALHREETAIVASIACSAGTDTSFPGSKARSWLSSSPLFECTALRPMASRKVRSIGPLVPHPSGRAAAVTSAALVRKVEKSSRRVTAFSGLLANGCSGMLRTASRSPSRFSMSKSADARSMVRSMWDEAFAFGQIEHSGRRRDTLKNPLLTGSISNASVKRPRQGTRRSAVLSPCSQEMRNSLPAPRSPFAAWMISSRICSSPLFFRLKTSFGQTEKQIPQPEQLADTSGPSAARLMAPEGHVSAHCEHPDFGVRKREHRDGSRSRS